MANRISCYVCGVLSLPRTTIRLFVPANEQKREIAVRRRSNLNSPLQVLNDIDRICFNCNKSINSEIQDVANNPDCLRLNVLHQTDSSSCLFCNRVKDTSRLSINCRVKIFVAKNIFVPDSCRCCDQHLDTDGNIFQNLLDELMFTNRQYLPTGKQLQQFFGALRQQNNLSFGDENTFSDEEFSATSPICREQFQDL